MSSEKHASAVRYHRTGHPAEVVQVDRVECEPPGAGEVTVRMEFSPINPADLNMLEGKYGEARPLPDVPGNEGCGRVVAIGDGVDGSWLGRRVLVDCLAWRERGNWALDALVPVPDGLQAAEACVLRVNPPTAWLLLHNFVALHPDDWVLQNAATSAVGRAVIEIAKNRGWKTMNFVRRPEAVDELAKLGADAVVVESDDAAAQASAMLRGAQPKLALNAVGGVVATRLAGLLAPGGTMVTYGAMSKEALKIPNGFLIFRDLQFRGFWLTRWLRDADPAERAALFAEVFRLASLGCFRPRVAATFPMAQAREAVALAASGTADGKVLLRFDG